MRDEIVKRFLSRGKRDLYSILLRTSPKDLTDNEVEIMALLATDEDVQEALEAARKSAPVVVCDGMAHSKLQEIHGGKT